jgi:hypothetical protein
MTAVRIARAATGIDDTGLWADSRLLVHRVAPPREEKAKRGRPPSRVKRRRPRPPE